MKVYVVYCTDFDTWTWEMCTGGEIKKVFKTCEDAEKWIQENFENVKKDTEFGPPCWKFECEDGGYTTCIEIKEFELE